MFSASPTLVPGLAFARIACGAPLARTRPLTSTVMVWLVSPAAKVSVPEAAV